MKRKKRKMERKWEWNKNGKKENLGKGEERKKERE